jgi:DNA invertase Pin-like site-specific DNA recombinase
MNIYENYFREVIRMLVGYMRVSTEEQTTSLQKDALLKYGVDERNIFADVVSGASKNREGLNRALEFLKSGDILVVWKLDRLGRSLAHLISIITSLKEKNIAFVSLTEGMDTTTASGELFFHIFGALAEFEHSLIVERTKAGLAAARARGRKGGRKLALSDSDVKKAAAMLSDPLITKTDVASHFKVSRTTLNAALTRNGFTI